MLPTPKAKLGRAMLVFVFAQLFLVLILAPPTILFLHGDKDEFCSVESLRSLADKIPHAEVVIFENCGHFFDEHLNALRDTVRDWVLKQIQNHR